MLVVGLLLLPVGVIALGVAMLGAPVFGKGVVGVGLATGVLGLAAGVVLLIDPGSLTAIVSVLSLIVFHLVLGWKVYGLSRGTVDGSGYANAERQSARASEAAWIAELTEETK